MSKLAYIYMYFIFFFSIAEVSKLAYIYMYFIFFFSIAKEHAVITNKNGTVTLKPGAEAKTILVNGSKISKEKQLSHNDRYFFNE